MAIKGTILPQINVAMGQSKGWSEDYEWIENDGFPKELPKLSTTDFPVIQMTISTVFNNTLATDDNRIENVYLQFKKGDEEPFQVHADYIEK